MDGNFSKYWRAAYRDIVPAVAILAIVLVMPPFQLFEESGTAMAQSHLLLEFLAVVLAILIAVMAWHDLEKSANPQSGILLAGFSVVAVMDMAHALTYGEMPGLITESSTQTAIYFRLAGGTVAVVTLLLLALNFRPNLQRRSWLAIAVVTTAATCLLGAYGRDLVPGTYVAGTEGSTVERYLGYGQFAANIVLALIFIHQAPIQTQRQFFALATSCFIMAMGVMLFASDRAPPDLLNIFGHVFKLVSYVFLYQYVLEVAIRMPDERARKSEARLRALTELSADWLWEQDVNFRFTEISPGFSTLGSQFKLGLARWQLPHSGLTDEQWQAHRAALERHEPFKNLVCQITNDAGEPRSVAVSGAPIFGPKGEFQGYRGIGTDITDRLAAERQIEFLAYHDVLTGLPNRLLLQDRFEQASVHATRAGTRVALLYLDLDNFKNVNDNLGHDVGDALLQQVATSLSACVRDTDTISRQGGDEFLIVLDALSHADDTLPVLDKIVQRLREPLQSGGAEIYTSVSIGVAVFPEDGRSFESLRRKADMAMYQAKNAGRNTYRFFNEAMNEEAAEYLLLRNGLCHALERSEFVLHYQPQIDLFSGAVIGVEALIRWNHPQLGLVTPARFLTLAEESGMIVPIGDWVLRTACRQAKAWTSAGLPPLTMSVNLSTVQFKRGDIEKSVALALQESGLNPGQLELELTELILGQNAEKALATVKRLKLLGVKLSIDDFGTGYSSPSYLKRFGIDKLKINPSFVRDLSSDPDVSVIVRAIIQMARSLNLRTIAEGVETAEMLRQLNIFQCDEAQGYHFERPMSEEAMDRYLHSRGGDIVARAPVVLN